MTASVVVVAVAAVMVVGLALWFLWWQRPRNYHAETPTERVARMAADAFEQIAPSVAPFLAERVRGCDQCDAPATVHLVETFDDAEEREFGGGSTAMRADYCQAHADELGVG